MIVVNMKAVKANPNKPLSRLIAQVEAGHTVRTGLYIPRRGFPRWQWQLFSPAGEFVEVVKAPVVRMLRDAGYGDAISGIGYGEKGITRHQVQQ